MRAAAARPASSSRRSRRTAGSRTRRSRRRPRRARAFAGSPHEPSTNRLVSSSDRSRRSEDAELDARARRAGSARPGGAWRRSCAAAAPSATPNTITPPTIIGGIAISHRPATALEAAEHEVRGTSRAPRATMLHAGDDEPEQHELETGLRVVLARAGRAQCDRS